jgi:hypothetical protein
MTLCGHRTALHQSAGIDCSAAIRFIHGQVREARTCRLRRRDCREPATRARAARVALCCAMSVPNTQ